MQKYIRLRLIRNNQRNTFPSDHTSYKSVFAYWPLETKHPFDNYYPQKWPEIAELLQKTPIVKKKYDNYETWKSTALRITTSSTKKHLLASQFPIVIGLNDSAGERSRPSIRKGLFIKKLFQNQDLLNTSSNQRLRPRIRSSLFRLSIKKTLKRYEQRQKKSIKHKKNENTSETWLGRLFGTKQRRYISARRWREKKEKKRGANRFFTRNKDGRETHTHLQHPGGWGSKPLLVHPVRLRHYAPDITYNKFFWRKHRWLSPKKFNTTFFSGYTKASARFFRQEKWQQNRWVRYELPSIYRIYRFGLESAIEGILWPDQVPLNKPITSSGLWTKTARFYHYIKDFKRYTERYYALPRNKRRWTPEKREEYAAMELQLHKADIAEAYKYEWGDSSDFLKGFRFQNWLVVHPKLSFFNFFFNQTSKPDETKPKLAHKKLKRFRCLSYDAQIKHWIQKRRAERESIRQSIKQNRNSTLSKIFRSQLRVALSADALEKALIHERYLRCAKEIPFVTNGKWFQTVFQQMLKQRNIIFKQKQFSSLKNQILSKWSWGSFPRLAPSDYKTGKVGFEEYLYECLKISFSPKEKSLLNSFEKLQLRRKTNTRKMSLKKRTHSAKEYSIFKHKVKVNGSARIIQQSTSIYAQKMNLRPKSYYQQKNSQNWFFKEEFSEKISILRERAKKQQVYMAFFKKVEENQISNKFNFLIKHRSAQRKLQKKAKQESMLSSYIHTETDCDFKQTLPLIQHKDYIHTVWITKEEIKEETKEETKEEIKEETKEEIKEETKEQTKEETKEETEKRLQKEADEAFIALTNRRRGQVTPESQAAEQRYATSLKKEFKFPEQETKEDIAKTPPTPINIKFTKKTIFDPSFSSPRYLNTLIFLRGRPMRRKTAVPGKGARAFARLYKTHFLANLMEISGEKKVKLWRQFMPYGFNSPYSYRWRRLDRRNYVWSRHRQRFLRWGPKYGARVLTRIRKGRPIKKRFLSRLFKRSRFKTARSTFWTLTPKEWRLRLRQLNQQVYTRRKKFRALIWLNKQLTATYQDAKINMKTGEIKHAVRIRKFVMRRRRVRSFRRKKKISRWLAKRIYRWNFYQSHYRL